MGWANFFHRFDRQGSTSRSTAGTLDLVVNDSPLFDEALLARLRRLVLLSRRAVAQGIAGEHKSRRKGSSPEFADFKSYSQGDDYRRIDWNIYGRLDTLFIRLSEVTTELTIHILIDSSHSMLWKGSASHLSKFAYARRLAGSLAYVSLWHFDRVIITPFSDKLGHSFGPSQGRSQVQPALQFLTLMEARGATDLLNAVQRYASGKAQPGTLILISDLLSEEAETVQKSLRHLRNRGWSVAVIHVVDRAELFPRDVVFPLGDSNPVTIELVDLEAGDRLRLTGSNDLVDRYVASVTRWREGIEQTCIDEGADYIFLQTDWPFEDIVLRRLYEAGVVA